ncbi:MAG: hypothetical protein L6R40_000379 [Gallowayella cf. fulva]|nr:MAG: hypothetical protein L6R40_000379 [Xanthomendoza cf. fulva]
MQLRPLNQSDFAPFGTVIECPLPPTTTAFPTPPPTSFNVVPANQNTALKFIDVTHMKNRYETAPSDVPAKAVMNMFSCFPRRPPPLPPTGDDIADLDMKVLERHPYTTQTFIPLGDTREVKPKYLVVVAPTLPPTSAPAFQVMGPPDLANMKMFWAHGGQAVTYGAATWHMPMAVIGKERMDFVVVQYANGVAEEDCQEVEIVKGPQEKL